MNPLVNIVANHWLLYWKIISLSLWNALHWPEKYPNQLALSAIIMNIKKLKLGKNEKKKKRIKTRSFNCKSINDSNFNYHCLEIIVDMILIELEPITSPALYMLNDQIFAQITQMFTQDMNWSKLNLLFVLNHEFSWWCFSKSIKTYQKSYKVFQIFPSFKSSDFVIYMTDLP